MYTQISLISINYSLMKTVTLSPHIEEVSRDAERRLLEFIEQIFQKTRTWVDANFDGARRDLDHREEQNQHYLLEKELRSRIVESWDLYAFASLVWKSVFTFSDYLKDDDETILFDALDKDKQSFLILLAFYCAYRYWVIDGRNWVWNGEDISHYVPDNLDIKEYKWLVDNGLQVNSIIDIASEKFLERSKKREAVELYTLFLEFATSVSPIKLNWAFWPDFLDRADLQKDSPYFKNLVQTELWELWDVFIRDFIDWEYLNKVSS